MSAASRLWQRMAFQPLIHHPPQCDEIAKMVERRTVEQEVPGSNPAAGEFFAPCCSGSQVIGV